MSELVRLDWIRLHIDRIMLSPKWRQMQDFQRGWYIQLLLEMTRAAKIGYLPLNDDLLWRLAGARRKDFWMSQKELVMACFKIQSAEGVKWIYNDTLLAELEKSTTQLTETKQSRNSLRVCISSLAFEIYEKYPRKEGRRKALEEIDKAIDRLSKQEFHGDKVKAAGFISQAVSEFAASPAGNKGKFVPHPATWFHQDRFLDDRETWSGVEHEARVGKFAEIDRLIGSSDQAAD